MIGLILDILRHLRSAGPRVCVLPHQTEHQALSSRIKHENEGPFRDDGEVKVYSQLIQPATAWHLTNRNRELVVGTDADTVHEI